MSTAGKRLPAAVSPDCPVDDRAPVPAHLAVWVEALGEEQAAELFLTHGGSMLHISAAPGPGSKIAEACGLEGARRLGRELGPDNVKIPLARKWLCLHLASRGMAVNEIAAKIRADRATVQRHLADAGDRDQLSLL